LLEGLKRVSSDKQTVENQRFEINKFCDANDLTVGGWIEETISGTKHYDKRKLKKLRELIDTEI
jgi:DNA invertase Pin-like site-specific DNA recombinase